MRGTVIALLTIALIVLSGVGFYLTNPEAAQQVLVDLDLASPEPTAYVASGVLEAEVYYLGTELGGLVLELSVPEGADVAAGGVLARLETRALELELEVARSRVESARSALRMLETGARQVDIDVARAAVDKAETTLEAALLAVEDTREHSEPNVREEQVSLAEAHVSEAQAMLLGAQAVLDSLEKGPTSSELSLAQVAVDAAQAGVAKLEKQIEEQTIRAPIEGTVLDHLLRQGEMAAPGWPVVAVVDLKDLYLKAYVPEGDLGWFQVGGSVRVRTDAYENQLFRGRIVHVSAQAEFTPRNVQTPDERSILVYEVRIRVSDPKGVLKPGLPADVILEVRP